MHIIIEVIVFHSCTHGLGALISSGKYLLPYPSPEEIRVKSPHDVLVDSPALVLGTLPI